jgi:hypothetical protein
MADTKISADPVVTALAAADIIPVVQGGVNKAVTGLLLATAILGATVMTGATVTTSQPVINVAQTWNAGAVSFTGIKFNATDTASAAGSLLLDLQVGGASKFNVGKSGAVTGNQFLANNNQGYVFTGFTGSGMQLGSGNAPVLIASAGNQALGWWTTYVMLPAAYNFGWSSTSDPNGTMDTFLTRKGAANPRFGAADAAAPVAQIISFQGVVAGTSNTNGPAVTFQSPQSTGSGTPGGHIFQSSPAGAAPTVQNAFVTAATIGGATSLLALTAGTAARSQMNFATAVAPTSPNGGDLWFDGTNFLYRTAGGATKTITAV